MSDLPLFDRPGGEEDDPTAGDRVLRVAEVNRAVRGTLEEAWPDVWIEGELSDVTRAASGHVYFTLNDEREPAQLRGVMFRGDARRAKARLERGAVVRMRGGLSLYEPRGGFQLIARLAVPAGEGDLHAQFERLRRKLEAEGLMDPARKRPLPRLPRVLGVVTSAAGAAMHDIVRVARGRCPVRIVVSDCRVQGQEAPASIVAALTAIQQLPLLDAVIIGRGGGAQEDLWAFNHESVARAIAACRVPTVSGVGHEVDVSIADLVADVRASTPSNAAEIAVPDRRRLLAEVDGMRRRLDQQLDTRVGRERLRLERLDRGLADPRRALGGVRARLTTSHAALERGMRRRLAGEMRTLADLRAALAKLDARATLERDRRALTALRHALAAAAPALLTGRRRVRHEATTALRAHARALTQGRRARLSILEGRMLALSPKAVLSRGYAIALHAPTGRALLRASDAHPGDEVELVLSEGRLGLRVEGQGSEEE